MLRVIAAALITLLAAPAFAAEAPKTEDQKTLYAVGLVIARQLTVFGLTPNELEMVEQGIGDGVMGKTPQVNLENYHDKIQQLAVSRRDAYGKKLAAESKKYLEKAAKEKGAIKTASGLVYQPVKEGTGPKPGPTDKVKVNYRGTLIDGKEFDSSYAAGEPAEFPLDKVIKCWTEGLQLMKAGGKGRFICPPELAYGERGSGIIPANSTLIFDVELLEVVK